MLGEQLVNQRIDHSLWIENDLPWIEASDALYRLPGDSKGADAEVAHAIEYEIPVYRDLLTLCDHFRGGLKNA